MMDQIVEPEARAALVEKIREDAAQAAREGRRSPRRSPPTTTSVRSAAATDNPIPEPPFWGVREIDVDLDEVYPHLDTHVLFKLHWGGRGVKGDAWKQAARGGLPPAPGAHVGRAGLPAPARAARLLPLLLRGQRDRRARPGGPRDRARAPRLPAPAQGRPHLAGRLLPPQGQRRARRRRAPGRHRRRRGHRADGPAGGRRRVRRAALHPRPRRADRRGHGRVAALARAPRPRHRARRRAAATRGATPRCPSSPSTRRSSGCSTRPSRSACGCPAATPSSPSSRRWRSSPTTRRPTYFGMRNGRLLPDGSPDDVIKGSPRDPSLFGEIGDEEPAEPGTREPSPSTA